MSTVRSLTLVSLSLALAAGTAAAGTGLHAEALVGMNAEAEADQMTCRAGCTGSQTLQGEDLEGNFGIAATYEHAIRPQVHIGARASYLMGEGDDTDQELTTIGAGFWTRYLIPAGKVTFHVAGDVGPTRFSTEANVLGVKMDFTGIGFHAVVGGGLSTEISDGVELRGGLYYSYEKAGSLEAEEQGMTIEVEDATATRFLLTAGLGF